MPNPLSRLAEKLQIARNFLLPRQLADAGLNDSQVHVTDEALLKMIRGYTRESGVRSLERVIGSVCRKAATHFADGHVDPINVDAERAADMLGHERFRLQDIRKRLDPGVAAGLA